jgi:hypothetical protein
MVVKDNFITITDILQIFAKNGAVISCAVGTIKNQFTKKTIQIFFEK